MSNVYETVIGLEIHAQLLTDSKLFSTAPASSKGNENQNINAVCVGMPGTLPVLNQKAVELAVVTGTVLHCKVEPRSVFARKQYFYPDLSKGYQITQHTQPICSEGYVEFYVDNEKKKVRLERAHLEEDAGKSTHHGSHSLINYNRAGVPLLEIVSAPDMRSPAEAAAYARAVRQLLMFAETCDGNLDEGSLRCDCNVSIRKKGEKKLGVKVELKNLNSFRFIEKAIEYEVRRQVDCVENGEEIVQETRLYDSTKNKTFSMRTKEDAEDYRYFPDPDIPPVLLTPEMIKGWTAEMEESPLVKFERLHFKMGIGFAEAEILCSEKSMVQYFEKVLAVIEEPKKITNWIVGEMLARCHEDKIHFRDHKIAAQDLGDLIRTVSDGTLSGKMAKTVFAKMWTEGGAPKDWIKKLGLEQIDDEEKLIKIVQGVLQEFPEKVTEYKSGKEKLYGFFVGQIMKKTQGQANPAVVNKVLKQELIK